jgi:hypothetical protein
MLIVTARCLTDKQHSQKPRVRGELTRDTGGSEGAVAIDNTIQTW